MRRVLALAVLSLVVSATPARADLINLGNGMIYDSAQDLTWIQDTLLTQTLGLSPDGRLTNTQAAAWVSNLTFGGYDDWRLPRMFQSRAGYVDLFNDSNSEISTLMAGLGWYWEDAVREAYPYSTDNAIYYIHGSTGPFVGLEYNRNLIRRYWVETNMPESGYSDQRYAWFTSYELEYAWYHSTRANVWAVRDGLARVPEPSTLLTLSLGGLVLLSRRRRAARDSESPAR